MFFFFFLRSSLRGLISRSMYFSLPRQQSVESCERSSTASFNEMPETHLLLRFFFFNYSPRCTLFLFLFSLSFFFFF